MQLFINNLASRLASPLASASTTMLVPAEDAARLVGLGAGDYYLLTLVAVDGAGVETAHEIIKVTANAGGSLTIERAQEGTTPAEWPINTPVEARYTAGAAAEPASALAAHAQDAGAHPQYAAASAPDAAAAAAIAAHELEADPHSQYQQRESGKGLSTNDYTTEEKAKLAGLQPGGGGAPGDVLLTMRDPGAGYVLPGADYLQSAYPALFAELGLLGGTPGDASTWTTLTTAFGSVSVEGAASDGNGVWVAVGEAKWGRSVDDGATWSIATFSGFSGATDIATDGTGRWIVGGSSGALRVSTDNGVTWGAGSAGIGSEQVYSVGYANRVWLAGGINIMSRSTDGATFAPVTHPLSYIRGFASDGAGVWIAVADAGKIARSTDNGATWALVTSPFGATDLSSVATDGAGVWVAVGSDGKLARSTNNGATWALVTNPYPAEAYFNGVATNGDGLWVAVGSWGDGAWIRSTDNGASWSSGASALAKTTAYSVTAKGGTWVITCYGTEILRNAGSFPYNTATHFRVPAVTAPDGATAYIKATA